MFVLWWDEPVDDTWACEPDSQELEVVWRTAGQGTSAVRRAARTPVNHTAPHCPHHITICGPLFQHHHPSPVPQHTTTQLDANPLVIRHINPCAAAAISRGAEREIGVALFGLDVSNSTPARLVTA